MLNIYEEITFEKFKISYYRNQINIKRLQLFNLFV
jgi:hypothetical protein